jgi:hypothetical protein
MSIEMIHIGDGDKPATVDKTFTSFLRSQQGQAACGEDLISRLTPSASAITSLPALLRWSRERHPSMFPPQDWRAPLPVSQAPFGSTAMKGIWAKFLAWREAQ